MKQTTNTTRNTLGPDRTARQMLCAVTALAAALALTPIAAHGQCDPVLDVVGGGVNNLVYTIEEFDDGSGLTLVIGGAFQEAGGTAINHVAKWDGITWSAVGQGLPGVVRALTIFDDGTGETLYAANNGSSPDTSVQKLDGTDWVQIGNGIDGTVLGILAFDDGTGPALYVTGEFQFAGGNTVNNITRLDGQRWVALSGGLTNGRFEKADGIAVFDDGTGPALYVGGDFSQAGGVPANSIAKWDGSAWSALGPGLQGGDQLVRTLVVADLGGGPKLYAGGNFLAAGGIGARSVAVWDGSTWSPLGAGLNGNVEDMIAYDDGAGLALYATGNFTTSGATPVAGIARWDGVSWQEVGQGLSGSAWALKIFDDGSGSTVYVGGGFISAGVPGIVNIANLRIPTPRITSNPASMAVQASESASFSVAATSIPGPYSVRWRKDGVPLFDTQRITGTGTTTLTINPVEITDAGVYDALVTNVCGATTSQGAQLTVTFLPCYADCDQSTGPRVLDLFDFLCFQNAFVTFDPYADCDGNNVLDLFDFLCFQDAFVSGCP